MDYGQTSQSVKPNPEQAFFTAGAGADSEQVNNFEPENNLDLTNQAPNWDAAPAHKETEPQAIYSPESSEIANLSPAEIPPTEIPPTNPASSEALSAEFGQIVDLEMPPGAPRLEESNEITPSTVDFVKENIKTGEKLEPSGIKEVDDIIAKFSQDGSAASFYRSARDMMEVNLKNSYGENAAWKGAA